MSTHGDQVGRVLEVALGVGAAEGGVGIEFREVRAVDVQVGADGHGAEGLARVRRVPPSLISRLAAIEPVPPMVAPAEHADVARCRWGAAGGVGQQQTRRPRRW